jgi:small-conductance mechanosensitive channel
MPSWISDPWVVFAAALFLALLVAAVVIAVLTVPLRLLARRAGWDGDALRRLRRPFRVLVLVAALLLVAGTALPPGVVEHRDGILHLLAIGAIIATGWLLAGVIGFLLSRTLVRYDMDVADNRVARRVHTQVSILRRVIYAVIGVVTVGAVLLTFPGVQGVGASLLASAGVLSVVAGIAAQSTLGNVIAGIQLAFSDAIRVDDVVIVEGEFGRIEEITLTYIVVHIWDDRRMVLPSTYFTTTPFENWTRRGSELLGSVELDLDWTVSPAEMREHLATVLEADPLWDRRSSVLQITDATGGQVRVRILVTAQSAGTLWDLRCNVREAMLEWLHEQHQPALPRTRVALLGEAGAAPRRPVAPSSAAHEGVFSGSVQAERRAQSFTQSLPVRVPLDAGGDPPGE